MVIQSYVKFMPLCLYCVYGDYSSVIENLNKNISKKKLVKFPCHPFSLRELSAVTELTYLLTFAFWPFREKRSAVLRRFDVSCERGVISPLCPCH